MLASKLVIILYSKRSCYKGMGKSYTVSILTWISNIEGYNSSIFLSEIET